MDAAEEIFAERGYYGSSFREVSTKAGAALGLINHYFPTKESLFQAIVARKFRLLFGLVSDSLAESERLPNPTPKDIIRGFLLPFLSACVNDRHSLRNYMRLTSNFMSAYRVPEIGPSLQSLQPISDLFFASLRRVLPGLTARQHDAGVYFVEAALIFMVQDVGFLAQLTEGNFHTDRIDELIEPAATFFAAGLEALRDQPLLTRPAHAIENTRPG